MYGEISVNGGDLQDKTFDLIRDEISETRERIYVNNQQDVEILGKMKEELAVGDNDLRMQLQEANVRINQLDTLLENHSTTFVKYDSLVSTAASHTEQLVADMQDWTSKAVSIEFHKSSLAELEGNLRTLIHLLENKVTSQDEAMRRMSEQYEALEIEQKQLIENIALMKEKEKEHELELQEQRNNQAKFNDFYNSRAASASYRSSGGGNKMKYEDYDNEDPSQKEYEDDK